ncbi:MAG: hypothetical protein HY067_13325 [Betaproteobacteria bacterium]|nr:hypothetical protein [Betaproteobacteria bacterium]
MSIFSSRTRAGVIATASLMLICAAAQAASRHRYEVRVNESLDQLAVRACFGGTAPDALVADSDGARFYLESMRLGERLLEPVGDRVILGAVREDTCVEYQVKLQPAQSRVQTGGPETRRVGRDMLTSIGDWLWRPQEPEAAVELSFRLPSGVEVSTPWQRKTGSDGRPVFLVGATPTNWSGVVAFGHFVQRDVQVPGAVLHLALLDAPTTAQQAQLETWIGNTARHVAMLYGRFPVASLQVVVAPTPRGRGPVPWAYVSRGGGPAVHLFINAARPPGEFDRDWSLTHEMAHLFLPYVVSRDAWLFEGVPTYLQNVLMARGGAISVEEAWQRMQAGFQRGARTASDLSLARANERIGSNGIYLRVYWAGAALMLAADLQLRSGTGGRQSLDTALEQLARCCASEERRWNAQEIIVRLDEVTGTTVFSDLVRAQFEAEGFPDYEAVLARAGVKVNGVQVEFDASAPWAAERDALMQPVR